MIIRCYTEGVCTLDSAHSLALSGVRSIKDKVAEFIVYQCMLKTRWMAYSLHITMHVFVSLI